MLKAVSLLLILLPQLWAFDAYQVAFETLECSGESGFATVKIEDIDKIKSAGCSVDGKKLKTLMVRKNGSYAIYTLSEDEARNVMNDVKTYMRAKLQMMQNATPVVITK